MEKEEKDTVEKTENSDYEFIREKIKERPLNRKRLTRRMIITAGMAVIFGLIACLTFLVLEPVLGKLISGNEDVELSLVTLPEAEVNEDAAISTSINLIDESVLIEEIPIEDFSLEDKDMVSGNVISQNRVDVDNVEIEIDDYQRLYKKMHMLSDEVSKSIVLVTGADTGTDSLQLEYAKTNSTTGLIIAENGSELLVLCCDSNLSKAKSISITFPNKVNAQAELKAKDKDTGISIYAIKLEDVDAETKESYTIATLGSTSNDILLGSPIIAIGNLLPTGRTITYGVVTSTEGEIPRADENYQMLTTDIFASSNANGFLINLRGQFVGIISSDIMPEDINNIVVAYGMSSIRPMMEKLSNNEKRAYAGLYLADVNSITREALNMPRGAYVVKVDTNSPAQNMGITAGDVIVNIGGLPVTSVNDYEGLINKQKPGDRISVVLMRLSGEIYKEMNLELELKDKE